MKMSFVTTPVRAGLGFAVLLFAIGCREEQRKELSAEAAAKTRSSDQLDNSKELTEWTDHAPTVAVKDTPNVVVIGISSYLTRQLGIPMARQPHCEKFYM